MTQSTIDSEVEARILTFMSGNLHIILEDEGDQSEIPSSKFAKDLAAQLTNTIAQEANKANEQGFYAAMGMCGVKESLVHGYYVMYQDALKNPELSKKAIALTADKEQA